MINHTILFYKWILPEIWACNRREKAALFLGIFNVVLLPESFYPACSIHKLLLPGKKRMACGAYFNMLYVNRRLCLDLVSAGTGYDNVFILRMYAFFHLKLHIYGFVH